MNSPDIIEISETDFKRLKCPPSDAYRLTCIELLGDAYRVGLYKKLKLERAARRAYDLYRANNSPQHRAALADIETLIFRMNAKLRKLKFRVHPDKIAGSPLAAFAHCPQFTVFCFNDLNYVPFAIDD